jgi:hypothetical protein
MVPVRWVNSDLVDLFHAVDTWQSAVNDECLVPTCGNRPLTRLHMSKESVVEHVMKGLPRNWYDDTWYKSQSDPQKLVLSTRPSQPIPSLVSFRFPFFPPQ